MLPNNRIIRKRFTDSLIRVRLLLGPSIITLASISRKLQKIHVNIQEYISEHKYSGGSSTAGGGFRRARQKIKGY